MDTSNNTGKKERVFRDFVKRAISGKYPEDTTRLMDMVSSFGLACLAIAAVCVSLGYVFYVLVETM